MQPISCSRYLNLVYCRLLVDGEARASTGSARGRMRLPTGLSLARSDVIYDVKWSSGLDRVLAGRSRQVPDVT